jgi:5-formyltetrahydrofolate cyclo-ligase
MTIASEKKTLRALARARRAELAKAIPDHAARLAAQADALEIPQGAVVSGFLAMPGEVDPGPLMARLAEKGCTLAVPRVAVKAAPLVFHRWTPDTKLVVSSFGVSEPDPATPRAEPGVLLVPLLAFDSAGYRLGYGGGFYDRTLAALRAKGPIRAIGVAYAGQEVETLPHDGFDARLDMILTENGIRTFARTA